MLEFYGPGLVKDIDATQPPVRVLMDILRAVDDGA